MNRLAWFLIAIALVGGCSRKNEAPRTAPTPAAQPAKPALGAFGLDRTSGNPNTKPGDDFFAYASGHWFDTFTIPEDKVRFGPFDELADLSEKRVNELIGEAASSQPAQGTPEQKIGDYYATFMDEAGIEAKGLASAQPDLDRISSAKSKAEIAALFGSPGFVSTFGVGILPDLKDPNRYALYVSQAGLGLPDRDYYLRDDPKLAEIRSAYTAYVSQMLELGGHADTVQKAAKIMAFETAIARVQWPIEKQRDVVANYNPRSKAQLLAYARGFDWQPFFDASDIGNRETFILGELTAIRDIAGLIGRTPLATLRDYTTFHYLSDHASILPRRFDEASFAFYGKTLRGQPKQRERWKRAVAATSGALGEQIGQVYVKKYFPPESKAKMEQLVANLRRALAERLDQNDWMGAETKKKAHEKLAAFVTKIGYPDKWKDYSALEVVKGDAVGNSLRAQVWDWKRQLARIDGPVNKVEWEMTPQTVNAYYNPLNNEIVFPAAILQPPFFDPLADDAINYGAIGAVIGHEIGHGFDDQGRKFAANGSLTDWWTKSDAVAFDARAKKLIAQFSGYEVLPGLKVKGENTVGENIGDLGGLNMAYHAYHLSLGGKEPPVMDGLTGDQRFFLSWAQVWRAKYRDEALREQIMSDVHSPAYFRVNGPVANMDAWYAAFNVQPGDKLYLKPEDRVRIW